MRIIDEKNRKTLSSILIMLTTQEAKELRDYLEDLNPDVGDHLHVSDINYKREITIAIYTDKNMHFFSEEIRNIIALDQ